MNRFESEVSRSAVVLGLHYEKLPIPTKLGVTNGRPFLIKLHENLYDGFLVHNGRHIPLEMKSQAVYGSFPLANIEDHQIIGLRKMVDLGCIPYLLINQRRVIKEGKKVSRNRAWSIDFRDWDRLLREIGDRKSIPVELFEVTGGPLAEIPRIKAQHSGSTELVWDLGTLLER